MDSTAVPTNCAVAEGSDHGLGAGPVVWGLRECLGIRKGYRPAEVLQMVREIM